MSSSMLHAAILCAAVAISAGCAGSARNASDASNADASRSASGCHDLPPTDSLKHYLAQAPDSGEAGGLFHGRAEWAAVVDRDGTVCEVIPPNDSAGGRWPGSRNIAKAKAFTANALSTDTLAFSTARLYTLTQPGHSLWGLGQPETYAPDCLRDDTSRICGGAIAFGGGVPLYHNGRVIGGLGVSGDTPCADHEIAKRIRHFAGLDPRAGMLVDDITYSSVDKPSIYTHPLCPNTWRNGQKIGEEPPAAGY